MATKILIRFDDICPTMDFKLFKRATDLLDKYGVRPLIGVIPECKDPDLMIEAPHDDFWDYVKDLQSRGYTVAMHGYNHVFDSHNRGLVTKRIGSEFAGHPLDVQIEKIRRGKEILNSHGIYTDIFFAPAHSYDENTIKALEFNGFKFMSDGKSNKPYLWHNIKCLPCRAGGCPKIKKAEHYTAVFHAHEWVRADKAAEFDRLKFLLANHTSEIVSFESFAQIKSSNLIIQLIIEQWYAWYSETLKPILVNIYRLLR